MELKINNLYRWLQFERAIWTPTWVQLHTNLQIGVNTAFGKTFYKGIKTFDIGKKFKRDAVKLPLSQML